jgi:mono/diheme cytochrome c family protein
METLAFVAFWILLGVGLVLFGLRGSRHQRAAGPGRASRGFWVAGLLLSIVLLGIAIPAAIVIAVENRDDIPDAGVKNLTENEKDGRELFVQRCANCHTLGAAQANAKVGPNLDQLQPPPALVLDAIENGRARGNGQMAADLVEGEDAENVAAFVAKAVGSQQPAESEGEQ